MRILSIQIGLPQTFSGESVEEKEWSSAIAKNSVSGPVRVLSDKIEGDGQANLAVHGGPDKAICVYPSEHLASWKRELNRDFAAGAFGENLTTLGLLETEARIGDTFEADETILQITQPRQPCWKLARRWRIQNFALLVQQSGRTGWYFRVLKTGAISPGAPLTLIDRPNPTLTIEAANQIMRDRKSDPSRVPDLANCPELSESWRTTLRKRLGKAAEPDPQDRLNPAPQR